MAISECPFRRKDGQPVVESLYRALHAQTRQLAESGGDRNQSILSSMPGPEKNPVAWATAKTGKSLEPENEP